MKRQIVVVMALVTCAFVVLIPGVGAYHTLAATPPVHPRPATRPAPLPQRGQPIAAPAAASKGATSRGGPWTLVAPMPTARYGLAAATGSDGRIYAIGGLNGATTLNTVEAYTPSTNTWAEVAPLLTPRAYLAAAEGQDGRIYAMGGVSNGSVLNSVDAYSPTSNTWTPVAPMPTAREGLAATADLNGNIYAIGGYDGTNVLGTIEVYSPATNSWSENTPLFFGSAFLAATTDTSGNIYLIGGYGEANPYSNQNNFLPTTSVSSPSSQYQYWNNISNMPTARDLLAAVTGADGAIYALGGYYFDTAEHYLNTVEAFTTTLFPPPPTSAFQG